MNFVHENILIFIQAKCYIRYIYTLYTTQEKGHGQFIDVNIGCEIHLYSKFGKQMLHVMYILKYVRCRMNGNSYGTTFFVKFSGT